MRALVALLVLALAPVVAARDLTFDERVEAQARIERVRYAHLIDATEPFEAAVPRALLERKVETYLRQNAALERSWNVPVTAAMLEREMRRMATQSRLPERLSELFLALGGDAFVIQECLARPILVERLARNRLAEEPGERTRTWDDWWAEAGPEFSAIVPGFLAHPDAPVPSPGVSGSAVAAPDHAPCDGEAWASGVLSSIPGRRSNHTAVWTGSELLVWGGVIGEHAGLRYDPTTDTWTMMSTINAPSGRTAHAAVWTGSLMVVWGANDDNSLTTNTGGRYDPLTDTWSPTTLVGVPEARSSPTAVWTGSAVIFWGGRTHGFGGDDCNCCSPSTGMGCNDLSCQDSVCGVDPFCCSVAWDQVCANEATTLCTCCTAEGGSGPVNTGGRYDPVNDTWSSTSLINAPTPRSKHSAVWTGSRMIVWGGFDAADLASDTGGLYDPFTNSWSATATADAPLARTEHSAVWTGSEMIVWGGRGNGEYQNSGGRYDPTSNSWSATSLVGAPPGRKEHPAVWTGTKMIVWGGIPVGQAGNNGGRYDPASNSWTSTSAAGAPLARRGHSMTWTGTEAIVWGGDPNYANGYYELYGSGGRYDPVADTWSPTFDSGAPQERGRHTAVWTGTQMIVWGGATTEGKGVQTTATGGRYDPATDSWSPTSTVGAPSPRFEHTAVWGGGRMIVWGGGDSYFVGSSTGGRYDPIADSWTPTSTVAVPSARADHTAVWTGSRMIVWGGTSSSMNATGGSYNPATDSWTPTSTTGAPVARYGHSAVWTGSKMIVWGGYDSYVLDTGGAYAPSTDSWSPVALGGPSARYEHAAVWTGNRMVVWGGLGTNPLNTGSRYDPQTNTWAATSLTGAPAPADGPTAVWTGVRMIVWGKYSPTGGRYDPLADAWQPVTSTGAPDPPSHHTAVWTGSKMIVWGGVGSITASGGIYDPDGTDADGDGVGCALDCNDAAPGAFGFPIEVRGDRFEADKKTLEWPSLKTGLGTATAYDVARGEVAELPVGSGSAEVCLAQAYAPPPALGTGLIKLADTHQPAPGAALWYLVRTTNPCGIGTYGSTSAAEERITAICP